MVVTSVLLQSINIREQLYSVFVKKINTFTFARMKKIHSQKTRYLIVFFYRRSSERVFFK